MLALRKLDFDPIVHRGYGQRTIPREGFADTSGLDSIGAASCAGIPCMVGGNVPLF